MYHKKYKKYKIQSYEHLKNEKVQVKSIKIKITKMFKVIELRSLPDQNAYY